MQTSKRLRATTFPALLCGIALTASIADAQVVLMTKIADQDSEVRGTGDAPALHHGTIAFYGYQPLADVTGVFVTPATGSGQFVSLARQGDAVPNHPGSTFGNFDNPSIYRGMVAFTGGWGSNSEGLYLSTGGALQVLVDYIGGDPRPRFTFLGPKGVTFEVQDFYETPAYVPLSGGSLFALASPGEEAPGGGTFATFSTGRRGPSFGGGLASFSAYVNHPLGVDLGVYTNEASSDQLGLIANWNNLMPGTAMNFDYFGASDTDGQTVVFNGNHGYINFGGHTGVFTASADSAGSGPFTVIAEKGDPAPGSGVPFRQFGEVAVDRGLVVFAGYLDSQTEPNHGLYGWLGGTLFKIIDNGDDLFGEAAIDFSMSSRGLDRNQLVFRGRYHDPDAPWGQGVGMYVATILRPRRFQ